MEKNVFTVKNSLYREADLQRLRGMRLMDDDFMTKVFDGHPECIELVLQIILDKPDLKVIQVQTQVFVENLIKRSVRFDVLATDTSGKMYNVEVQRADKGAGRKRARYNSSMMDINILDKGGEFKDLPETYVVFITENDVLMAGFPVYHIERWIEETKELFDDDEHILYVNGAYRDDTPIGKLMHDFSCTQPDNMKYPLLAERARYFKETEEGREIMCKIMEDMVTAANLKLTLEYVKKMMNSFGISLEQAMDALKLSQEERDYIVKAMEKPDVEM